MDRSTTRPASAVREGLPFVILCSLVALLAWPRSRFVAALGGTLGAACLLFFRDPRRVTPDDPRAIFAAADGKIVRIDRPGIEPFLYGPCVRVVTFLSLVNVHVNRAPIAGAISLVERRRGGFRAAYDVEASDDNASELMGITGSAGPVLVRRTAGLVARRIVTWTRRDERVAAGQKLGMLKFGSRTDVLIPEGVADVLVKEGDYVRAGCSILARYR